MTQDPTQFIQAQEPRLARGEWRGVLESLTAFNREHPSAAVEERLAELRLEACEPLVAEESRPDAAFPPHYTDRFDPDRFEGGIPVIDAAELDVNHLACGVLQYGSVIVRGLMDSAVSADLARDINRVLAEKQRRAEGAAPADTAPWFAPPSPLKQYKLGVGRKFIADTGGIWAIDSPRLLFRVFEQYERLGLRSLLTEYFGEPPCVSVRKWVLRRVQPLPSESDWHQDGSFMGTDLHSMNLWIALNDCGRGTDVPGIDIVPRRLEHIVQMGSDGARFNWTVGADYVPEAFPDTPPVTPRFQAGDAVFFDHFNLHRTSYSPDYRQPRYAIECWFFTPSSYPEKQIPLVF